MNRDLRSTITTNAAKLRRLEEDCVILGDNPGSAEARNEARREYGENYDDLAFPGGLRSGLNKIAAGDLKAIEAAIIYLELRPFFFRAQYQRDVFIRLLKRQKLPTKLKHRFEATLERIRAWHGHRRMPD